MTDDHTLESNMGYVIQYFPHSNQVDIFEINTGKTKIVEGMSAYRFMAQYFDYKADYLTPGTRCSRLPWKQLLQELVGEM